MAPTDALGAGTVQSAGERFLERGIRGARVLVVRGVALRVVSIGTNVALIALVTPADLGLLAVVRGALWLVQFTSELGFEWVLVRRRDPPTRAELGAFAGARTMLISGLVIAAVVTPGARTLFGLIPPAYGNWMLLTLGVLVLTPIQSVSKVLLERDLAFVRLGAVEVSGVIVQNVGLALFALGGRFTEGVFIVQALVSLYSTGALYLARPLATVSFDLRPLRTVAREGFGFSAVALMWVIRDSFVPIFVAKVLDLRSAGLWSFATRAGQPLQLVLESYFRAALPVAGQLEHSPALLNQFVRRIARQTGWVVLPLTGVGYALLPAVAAWFPAWADAIAVAQLYLLAFGVLGVVRNALWPLAVARAGDRAARIEQGVALGVMLGGLVAIRAHPEANLALPFVAGALVSAAYLARIAPKPEALGVRHALTVPLLLLAATLGATWVTRSLGASAILSGGAGIAVAGAGVVGAWIVSKAAEDGGLDMLAAATRTRPSTHNGEEHLRILHLSNGLDCVGNGIINIMVDLALAQRRLGHAVTIAAPKGEYVELLRAHGVQHVDVPQRGLANALRATARVRALVTTERVDIVHAHMMSGAVVGRLAVAGTRARLVTALQSSFKPHSVLMGLGHLAIAPSDAVRREMRSRGIPARRMVTVLNGTVGSLRSSRPVEPIDLQHPAVLTVAGMYVRKGIEDLLLAAEMLRGRVPDVKLYLAGEGPDRGRFEALARRRGLENVAVFLGYRPDASELMRQADVFVLASHADPNPLVISEACAAGVPIVASSAGGIGEALDGGRAGVLVPPGNPRALAEGLASVLLSPDLQARLRQSATTNTARLSVERMARETIAAYRALGVRSAARSAP